MARERRLLIESAREDRVDESGVFRALLIARGE
jgi:hypothetical protein